MKKLAILLGFFTLVSCSQIPTISFYDDNESMGITNVTARVEFIDCESRNVKKTLRSIDFHIEWMKQYTSAKGSQDVYDIVVIMDETLEGMLKQDPMSPAYCRIKKRNLQTQGKLAAEAIMGRF